MHSATTTPTSPVFTQADVSLLADIADGFSTVLHYDRLDDLRMRLRTAVEASGGASRAPVVAIEMTVVESAEDIDVLVPRGVLT